MLVSFPVHEDYSDYVIQLLRVKYPSRKEDFSAEFAFVGITDDMCYDQIKVRGNVGADMRLYIKGAVAMVDCLIGNGKLEVCK